MPVFALYNFNDNTTVVDDAPANGSQNGIYLNGASAFGGDLDLDGINDIAKIYPAPQFQLDRGTLEINFTPTDPDITGPQTVLSRDSVGQNQGSYRVDILPDGSVVVVHELEGAETTFTTGPGFFEPGDTIQLSYSWDQGGTGGQLSIENQTSGDTYSADVPNTVTMDMADQSQPWIVGAGQTLSNPDMLNDINQHFQGTVEYFSLSDTVDNVTNDTPDANPDVAETDEDTPVTIDVLVNDTDPNGDPLEILGTPTAPNGTVTVNPDGTLNYTPDPDFNGTDTITYTVTDPDGNTSTSTVTVTVNPVNDAPNADPDTSTTALNTPVTFAVLTNDEDVDGDTLSISGTPTSPDGTVVVNADGTLTFTPNDGFTGEAVVTYTITDLEGLTDTTTWTITVADSNTPDANPDVAETDEDTPVTIDVLVNDTDPNGDPLEILGTPTAPNGTVTVNPDGTLNYTPDPDFNGTDTITYTVTDPDGNTSTSTVTVTVNPVNDAPNADPDTSTTALNTPVTFAVLTNDDDVDGDTLSISGAPTSPDGTVVVNADGTLTFTPNDGFTGEAVVTYTITDLEGLTDTTTWTITVADSNTPDANPDVAETDEDTPVTIDVLVNDTDPNGDPLEILGTPTAPNGTVTVNPDGTLNYTPDPDFNGTDTITYTVTDPDGNTSTSTVTVTVNPVNDAPNADPDTSTTALNTPVTFAVLTNDEDVDGDTLSISGTPTSPDGTVVVNADGTLTFTPNDGFTGEAVVTYTITDLEGLTDTTTWTITVQDPTRDGIVRGTTAGELIDTSYIDPFDADRVDANDAILPGDGPNDDVILAGAGNDTVLAGAGNDTVISGTGDDSVRGGSGNDDLRGNDGEDTLEGGSGNDTVYGQIGNDVIDTSGASPLPEIDYPGLYGADTDPNNDRDLAYGGNGNDTIRTGDDADTIYGDDGRDLIDAGIDADLIYGGQGGDEIVGGEGADTIDGGTGSDLIYGGLNDVIGDALDLPDAVDLRPDNNRDSITGGTGDDTIYGRDDDDTMRGGAGNDLIDGGVDDDSAYGDAGNDTVAGSQGDDSSYGGADRDTFVVGTADNGTGDFIDGNEEGNDFDTLDLRGTGPFTIVYDATNPENGTVTFRDTAGNPTGTLDFINIENVIPCFTPGTMIATPKGEVPVEMLKAGDKVITRDNGIQEIRWMGTKALSGQDLRLNSHLQPVLVKAHSLGNGLPEQDMLVSPNHRLLVANDRTQLYFDEHEVLVAAKHLVGTAGIHAVNSIGVSYIHFMCDRHEVVLSNGAWTESFQPGDYTLKGMGNSQRTEIFELFPELKSQEGLDSYQAARRTLKRHEAKLLVR